MVSGNVISLFGSDSNRWPKNNEQVTDSDEFIEDRNLALEIWMPHERQFRTKFESLPTGEISKQRLTKLMNDYKEAGVELRHAFIGAECQIMRYFVELEEDVAE
jgi:hypothetical protein